MTGIPVCIYICVYNMYLSICTYMQNLTKLQQNKH